MSDFNVKFITLHYSSYIYILSIIPLVDRRCAGGRDVLNFLNFSPLRWLSRVISHGVARASVMF